MPVTIRSSLLLLVLSVLLPGVVGGIWYIATTFEAERDARGRTLRDTTRALAMVVDGQLAERAAVARVLAQSRWLDQAPEVQPDELRQFAQLTRRALQGMGGWVELRDGRRTLFDSRQPVDAALPAPASLAWSETPQVLPLLDAKDADGAHAAVVQPVQRGGATVLNLLVTIRPADLQRVIDAQGLPADWIGAVLDSRGVVVARHPERASFLGAPAAPDLRRQIDARQREGLFELAALDGASTMAYFKTTDRGWTYLSAMPLTQFSGALPRAVVHAVAGASVLLMLAVAAALWLSRRIAAPVRALKAAATHLQVGLPVQRSATGITECDDVAMALERASQVLQESRIELERQVAEAVARTRHVEQRASQTQRVEALGRLTGSVAHDFNNVLGVIANSAHLIGRHPAAAELQVPLSATLRAVDRGSRLTQHLLRFAGRQPVRLAPLVLQHWLPELQDLMRSVIGSRLQLSVHVSADTPAVMVDANELELALVNLALNARDAMPGGGKLQLSARLADGEESQGLAAAPERRYVLITFTDDGPGIDPDVLPRVFDPFFTTKESGHDMGLGLSQVHGFCVQLGGAARIASTPGLGTTVSLLLPADDRRDAIAIAIASATAPAPAPAVAAGIRGTQVLLVDDNEALGDVTAALLQAHGAAVRRAGNAADALRQVAEPPRVDVVLSDVVMPGGMDGVAFARRLRREQPTLPVVLITAFSSIDVGDEFVMLRKPCPQEDLLAALSHALSTSSHRSVNPRSAA
jgi:signal transduction histidine kinase/ActR/RegA family two-component response regulator